MSPFSKTTQSKMAACDALGLSYWSDHAATGCMWAVDANQQAHAIRWYRPNKRTSAHQVVFVSFGKPYPPYPAAPKREWVYPTYDVGDRVNFQAA